MIGGDYMGRVTNLRLGKAYNFSTTQGDFVGVVIGETYKTPTTPFTSDFTIVEILTPDGEIDALKASEIMQATLVSDQILKTQKKHIDVYFAAHTRIEQKEGEIKRIQREIESLVKAKQNALNSLREEAARRN